MAEEVDLRAARFKGADLMYLAASGKGDPYRELEKIFEWYSQSGRAWVRGTLATAGAAALSLVGAYLKGDVNLDTDGSIAALSVTVLSIVVLLGLAAWRAMHLAHLHREYVEVVWLLSELSEFKPQLAARLRSWNTDG